MIRSFLSTLWSEVRSIFVQGRLWQRCPHCGVTLLNGSVTSSYPTPPESIESTPRLCVTCRASAERRSV